MRFAQPLVPARFVRREKRFFIHAVTDEGAELVAHTNNTGRMSGCLFPGGRIWLSPAVNPARKLKWTLEIVVTPDGVPVGVNTALANRVTAEAIERGIMGALAGFPEVRAEVPYGSRRSRIDLLLTGGSTRVWVEVKNVSLAEQAHARFPDAPTVRGRKHLAELIEVVQGGDRAALVLCSQRPDARSAGPADDIDPQYGELLRRAAAAGVEVYGIGCRVAPEAISAVRRLDIDWNRFAPP